MDPNQQQYQQQFNTHQSQYFQPVPQGFQPQAFQQAPRIVPFSRPWHITKIVFRSIDLVFCIVVIGITSWVVNLPYSYDVSTLLFLLCSGPPAVLAIIWEIAEFITICARGGKLGIHPGAHVGLHLVIWLAFAAGAGVEITVLVYQVCDSYCRRRGGSSYFSTAVAAQDATLAFTVMLLIIHFILFVRACVETHKRNRQAPSIVMVPSNAQMYMNGQQPVMAQQYPQTMYPVPPQQSYTPMNLATPVQQPPQELKGQMTGNSLQTSNGGNYTQSHSESVSGDGTYYGNTHNQHHSQHQPSAA